MMNEEFKELPLIEHLSELKTRVIRVFIFFIIAFGIGFEFSHDIYNFLLHPLAKAMGGNPQDLQYTGITEKFFTFMKLSFLVAVLLSFPMIAYQFYQFLAPGLYKRERVFLIPFLIASPLLFLAGCAIVYYMILPYAYEFFLNFETHGTPDELPIHYHGKISEYLSTVVTFMMGFGLSFQMPIVIIILARLGVVQVSFLKRNRRYALVAIVILAAILTPPDVVSQIILAGILYALYEISIFTSSILVNQPNGEQNDE